eukprot:7201996-Lingulodinium_polyedra.AAC.1
MRGVARLWPCAQSTPTPWHRGIEAESPTLIPEEPVEPARSIGAAEQCIRTRNAQAAKLPAAAGGRA